MCACAAALADDDGSETARVLLLLELAFNLSEWLSTWTLFYVYTATLSAFAGAVFLLDAGLLAFAAGLVLIVHWLSRRQQRQSNETAPT